VAPHGPDAVVTLVLSEEVPEVTVRAVPRERVRVYVDQVTTQDVVTGEVARERVDVDLEGDPGLDPAVGPVDPGTTR
jgi:stress response protein YsnF